MNQERTKPHYISRNRKLVITPNNYNTVYVQYQDSTSNKVMEHSDFSRLLYAMPNITCTGLHTVFPVCDIQFGGKIEFNITTDKTLMQQLYYIENELLMKYANPNGKTPVYAITKQITAGNVNIHTTTARQPAALFPEQLQRFGITDLENSAIWYLVAIKISGIWESSNGYGLTYKFHLAEL